MSPDPRRAVVRVRRADGCGAAFAWDWFGCAGALVASRRGSGFSSIGFADPVHLSKVRVGYVHGLYDVLHALAERARAFAGNHAGAVVEASS